VRSPQVDLGEEEGQDIADDMGVSIVPSVQFYLMGNKVNQIEGAAATLEATLEVVRGLEALLTPEVHDTADSGAHCHLWGLPVFIFRSLFWLHRFGGPSLAMVTLQV